jgi:hypothetical protein
MLDLGPVYTISKLTYPKDAQLQQKKGINEPLSFAPLSLES